MNETADFLAALKSRYIEPQKLQDALYEHCPLLGMIPKDESMGGKYMELPMISIMNRKRSATYATAAAGTQDTEMVSFTVGYVNNHQFARWADNVMRDARKAGPNAVLEAVETEMDGALANLARDHGQGIFGNVGGAKGTIAVGGLSTTALTLANPEDAIHFEPGDQIVASANDGTDSGHSLLDSGDFITLVAVNKSTGVLTGDANWSNIAAIAAGNFLFHKGDFKLKASGLAGWIPSTTPTSTLFHGVNRSVNPVRLGGHRFNAGGLLPQDVVTRMAATMNRVNGAKPGVFICNDEVYADFETAMGNKESITINAVGANGEKLAHIGYSGISARTASGKVAIMADPNCPVNRAYMLTLDSWKAGSSGGPLVDAITVAGSEIQRGTSDDWFSELKSRWNLGCKAPWLNGVALLDTQYT